MYLENLVFDAADPQLLGRFWQAALGGEQLTDAPGIFETRLGSDGVGPELDLCFQPVADPPVARPRLRLELAGGDGAVDRVVERLLGLGARRLAAEAVPGPGVELADPEGAPFRVRPAAYADTGPLAVIALDSADPERDAAFWSWLTGWTGGPAGDADGSCALRHHSARGPVLELRPESAPKGEPKNRRHLDLRLESSDAPEEIVAVLRQRGGAELRTDWGDLPWTSYVDPSGNEFCLLPARS